MSTFSHFLRLALVVLLFGVQAQSYDTEEISLKADELPPELEGVGIEEKLGDRINMDLPFVDENGKTVTLREVTRPDRPFILSLIYYSCPNLCNFHLSGLTEGLKSVKWTAGTEFDVVAVSFDANETPAMAKKKGESYRESYSREAQTEGWHFLTGQQKQIEALTDQVGFSFKFDQGSKEWSHTSAAIMVTPEGKISRYLHGVHFQRQDLRLGLIEAARGKIGGVVESIVLFCFRFDPKKNKYTIYSYNLMKAGATVMVALMAVFLLPAWWRERQRSGKIKS